MFKRSLSHADVGAQAEKKAAQFLKKNGLKIVKTNFHSRYGEIDIIARERNCLVFVEVKLRKNSAAVKAAESITASKRKKIRITAQYYLQSLDKIPNCRFDAVLITGDLGDYRIEWVKNIDC